MEVNIDKREVMHFGSISKVWTYIMNDWVPASIEEQNNIEA